MLDGFEPALRGLRRGLLSLAAQILPRPERAQYRTEWAAESSAVAMESGQRSAVLFALRLAVAAPRTGFALRTHKTPVYFDALVVSIALSIPSLFFLLYGVTSGQPSVWVPHLVLCFGLGLIARSVWTESGGLFGTSSSKLGLVLVLGSSSLVTAINRLSDVINPVLEGPFRVLPGTVLAQIGVVLLLLSGRLGSHRESAARAGVTLTMVGMAIWATLALANTVMVESWADRMFHAVTLPSVVAVGCVCWIIRERNDLLFPS